MFGENIALGQFVVNSGKIQVIDPCYSPGSGETIEALNGNWYATTEMVDAKGDCNASITVFHESHPINENMLFVIEKGVVGVDSGQAGFFDSEVYRGSQDKVFYKMVCHLTSRPLGAGVYQSGAVSSSGWGDGGYDLHIAKKDGKLIAARIVFISEDELALNDEDDEYDYRLPDNE